MNALRNRVQLIGHVSSEPKLKQLDHKKKEVRITLSVQEVWYNEKGERVEDTQFHMLVLWGRTAETADLYVKKGQEIAVEGRLINRSYETPDRGKQCTTEVVVREMVMIGRPKH